MSNMQYNYNRVHTTSYHLCRYHCAFYYYSTRLCVARAARRQTTNVSIFNEIAYICGQYLLIAFAYFLFMIPRNWWTLPTYRPVEGARVVLAKIFKSAPRRARG